MDRARQDRLQYRPIDPNGNPYDLRMPRHPAVAARTETGHSIRGILAVLFAMSLLMACSNDTSSRDAAQSSPPSSVASQAIASLSDGVSPSDSDTNGVSNTDTETTPSESADVEPSDTQSSSGPPILRSGDTGRPLTLADVFAATDGWRDDRFDIASKSGLTGIGSVVTSCYESDPVTVELRLAEGFTKLKMNVGQANNSASSDESLVTLVIANGKQVDSHHIPFNTVQPFNVSVAGVNALIVQIYLDPDQCNKSRSTTRSVLAVIQGLTVY
jgi:hypothetical protein